MRNPSTLRIEWWSEAVRGSRRVKPRFGGSLEYLAQGRMAVLIGVCLVVCNTLRWYFVTQKWYNKSSWIPIPNSSTVGQQFIWKVFVASSEAYSSTLLTHALLPELPLLPPLPHPPSLIQLPVLAQRKTLLSANTRCSTIMLISSIPVPSTRTTDSLARHVLHSLGHGATSGPFRRHSVPPMSPIYLDQYIYILNVHYPWSEYGHRPWAYRYASSLIRVIML